MYFEYSFCVAVDNSKFWFVSLQTCKGCSVLKYLHLLLVCLKLISDYDLTMPFLV